MIIIGILYLPCALFLALYGFNTFVQRSRVALITGVSEVAVLQRCSLLLQTLVKVFEVGPKSFSIDYSSTMPPPP